MIQTMYAMMALGLVMLLSLSVQRSIQRTDLVTQTRQATGSASTMAVELLDRLEHYPFDAATDPSRPDGGLLSNRGGLTPISAFGTGCSVFEGCRDLDDFHGKSVPLESGGTLFDVSITVRYVNETQPSQPASTPTLSKEVIMKMTPLGAGQIQPITLARVYTYQRTLPG